MPRKKTVTRTDIVEAGFMQLITKGPKGFSSRKIAGKLNCSTQPIYLEFKNMDELKEAVFGQFEKLVSVIDSHEVEHDDPLIAASLKLLDFAETDEELFKALFLMEGKNGGELKRFCRKIVLAHINEFEKYKELSSDLKETLFTSTLLLTMGIATMRMNGLSTLDNIEVIPLLKGMIENRLSEPYRSIIL